MLWLLRVSKANKYWASKVVATRATVDINISIGSNGGGHLRVITWTSWPVARVAGVGGHQAEDDLLRKAEHTQGRLGVPRNGSHSRF